MHVYRYAARYLLGLAALAGAAFAVGVFRTTWQPAAFKAAELLMYTAGLFSILLVRRQLSLQEEQAKKTYDQLTLDHQWRTYSSLHQHFVSIPPEEIREKAYLKAEAMGFIELFNDRGQEISPTIRAQILADTDAWKIFRSYLDYFEEFCGAINIGLVDDRYAFALQGSRVVRNFTVFKPLIDHYQVTSPSSYCELQRVAVRWKLQMSVQEVDSVPMRGIAGGEIPRINPPGQ